MSEHLTSAEVIERAAGILDSGYDSYEPRYSEDGLCVGSNLVDAILPVITRAITDRIRDAASRSNYPGFFAIGDLADLLDALDAEMRVER